MQKWWRKNNLFALTEQNRLIQIGGNRNLLRGAIWRLRWWIHTSNIAARPPYIEQLMHWLVCMLREFWLLTQFMPNRRQTRAMQRTILCRYNASITELCIARLLDAPCIVHRTTTTTRITFRQNFCSDDSWCYLASWLINKLMNWIEKSIHTNIVAKVSRCDLSIKHTEHVTHYHLPSSTVNFRHWHTEDTHNSHLDRTTSIHIPYVWILYNILILLLIIFVL